MTSTRGFLRAVVAATAATAKPTEAGKQPADNKVAEKLTRDVTVGAVNRHLIALQRIADSNGGNRARRPPLVTTRASTTSRASSAAPATRSRRRSSPTRSRSWTRRR